MILLSGADLVLPDRVIGGDLVIEDDRITDLLSTSRPAGFDGLQLDLSRSLHRPRLHRRARARRPRTRHARGPSAIGDDRRTSASLWRHGVLPDVDRLLS